MQLRILKPTLLKTRPLQSNHLTALEKINVKVQERIEVVEYAVERGHFRIRLKEAIRGNPIWYVYQGHSEIRINGVVSTALIKEKDQVKLNVPFKSQLDNFYNPTGSCNVTSIAMCLQYLKASRKMIGRYHQFEDELYRWCLSKGYSRHSPQDLAKVVRDYDRKDDFTVWGTIERCQNHLRGGNPCVVHGYFTSFGHIIVLVGFDQRGFLVHDPYGEWFWDGYRTDLSGAFLHYSYNLIRRTCIPDGQFWVHYISS
ncbi:C39 family peptidase [Laspinema sp. D1]|uniref:C39 family peptidase n=1 Tax=Laspinema palackyanum D2a TaxID=2953684 RepID=A0ABT2MK08_9CYAN|nr:C39 family peptidase [Laspinema sp. D2a]